MTSAHSTYRQDVDDIRAILRQSLTHTAEDIEKVEDSLRLLSGYDGPQPLGISSNVSAARRCVAAARDAVTPRRGHGSEEPDTPRWVTRFYADALIDQRHTPGRSALGADHCIACSATRGRPVVWPCPITVAAPAGVIDSIVRELNR